MASPDVVAVLAGARLEVLRESADVANFALMLADRVGAVLPLSEDDRIGKPSGTPVPSAPKLG
jgi:hypothetical protein